MKHCKLALSIFVSTSLVSSTAFAHAIMKDAQANPAAPYNWTGYYIGLNAGAMKQTLSMTDNQASSFNATIDQASDLAFTGGLQVGYRRQLDLGKASGVYGVEFSANSSNVSYHQKYGSSFALYHLSSEFELNNYALLQLIGGIAADRTLLFLAAGLAWINISGSVTNLDTIPFFNSFNLDKKILGTALGAGVEYAFTDTISVRFKVDVITPSSYTVSDGTGDNFRISNSIVQGTVGVNYTFA